MNQMEEKAERYFNKCLADNQYTDNGMTRIKVSAAVRQLERMYPKIRYSLLRRKQRNGNKWPHLIIPAFYVESYVEEHNYEDADNWYSIEGSYREVKKEQQHLIAYNKQVN
tara:strand:- start:3236 stop:3568 length:333 start_codon:yes stop_codon:yes gene_type:complete